MKSKGAGRNPCSFFFEREFFRYTQPEAQDDTEVTLNDGILETIAELSYILTGIS